MAARGGKRQGAGRKPIAIEDNVKESIKAALSKDPQALTDVWAKVIENAKKGSDKHINILFSYYYGKPKENLEQPTEMIINVVRNR